MLGYVANNNPTTRGTVTLSTPGPRPGARTFDVVGKTEMEGFMSGAGFTIATGLPFGF